MKEDHENEFSPLLETNFQKQKHNVSTKMVTQYISLLHT